MSLIQRILQPYTMTDQVKARKPLERWSYLFVPEMEKVNQVILSLTAGRADLIPQLTEHLVSSGGKRLRPILTILSAKLCGYEAGDKHLNLAACIEFLHTATLLHDDVVDGSDLRRGKLTANNVWGNKASVLVGDFLLSRSFQLMAKVGSLEVYGILSDTSAIITEGEVKQLMTANKIETTEQEYLEIITAKTAQLFSAACEVGAVISARNEKEQTALRNFGQYMGIAFQIIDDALDYSAKQEELGKTIGDDFREGKVTLPIIFAYKKGNKEERNFWQRTVEDGQKEDDLQKAISLMKEHNVLTDTVSRAKEYAEKAYTLLDIFPGSEVKSAIIDLLEFTVNRPY